MREIKPMAPSRLVIFGQSFGNSCQETAFQGPLFSGHDACVRWLPSSDDQLIGNLPTRTIRGDSHIGRVSDGPRYRPDRDTRKATPDAQSGGPGNCRLPQAAATADEADTQAKATSPASRGAEEKGQGAKRLSKLSQQILLRFSDTREHLRTDVGGGRD